MIDPVGELDGVGADSSCPSPIYRPLAYGLDLSYPCDGADVTQFANSNPCARAHQRL